MTFHVLMVPNLGLLSIYRTLSAPKRHLGPNNHHFSSPPPSLQPWKPLYCLRSMDLPVLDILCKWSYSVCGFSASGFLHFPQPLQVHLGDSQFLLLPAPCDIQIACSLCTADGQLWQLWAVLIPGTVVHVVLLNFTCG